MRAGAGWMRLGGTVAVALAVAAGGAWAEDAGEEWAGDVGESWSQEGDEAAGEGADGGVPVAEGGGSSLPPGFCDDCEETGEFMEGVLADGGAAAGAAQGGMRGFLETPRAAKAGTGPADICASAETYVGWLCAWQGYAQP